jgi:hypothetical protein
VNPDAIIAGATDAFEGSLDSLSRDLGIARLVAALEVLDKSGLPSVEKERRFQIIFARAKYSGDELGRLATAAASLSSLLLRNAVAGSLPAELRPVAYGTATTTATQTSAFAQPSSPSSVQVNGKEDKTDERAIPVDFSDVLILSANDEPGITSLLSGASFAPYRCATLDALPTMLSSGAGICAVLVEPSFLNMLDKPEQLDLMRLLAAFSTFSFVRCQSEGLKVSEPEVQDIVRAQRCRKHAPTVEELSIRDRILQERELPNISAARDRLTAGAQTGLFTPGELTAAEISLLASAMARYSQERHFTQRFELTSLKTQFFRDGASGARVALVRVNDLRMPVVVKLDAKERIIEEAQRFYTYILRDNNDLNPEIHFHGPAALIIFDVIPQDGVDAEAAPGLREVLRDLWFAEMNTKKAYPVTDSLVAGFKHATQRLVALNSRPSFEAQFTCKANPQITLIKEMEDVGFHWGLGPALVEARDEAARVMETAATKAICHGDAHASNVLIRANQGFLIDYALSGPGHPCADLVKLELSLFLTFFHPFGSVEQLVAFQRDLTNGEDSVTTLEERYKPLMLSRSNVLCLRLCVIARDATAPVLEAHGLGHEHYVAVKRLTAWQSLLIPSLQQSLVRVVIQALQEP